MRKLLHTQSTLSAAVPKPSPVSGTKLPRTRASIADTSSMQPGAGRAGWKQLEAIRMSALTMAGSPGGGVKTAASPVCRWWKKRK